MEFPQINPRYTARCIDSDTVFLISDAGENVLKGGLYGTLVPMLTGAMSEDDLLDTLGDRYSAAEVLFCLDQLHSRGYVVERVNMADREQAAFWSALGLAGHEVVKRLRSARVSVTELTGEGASPLAESLVEACRSVGMVNTGRQLSSPELEVVVSGDYLDERLSAMNRRYRERNTPWMLVQPRGAKALIGPLFIPSKTGCYACLAQRLRGHRRVRDFVSSQVPGNMPSEPPAVFNAAGLSVIHHTVAMEIAKWFAGSPATRVPGKVLALDWNSGRIDDHVLVRRPQCECCGNPVLYEATAPASLHPRGVLFTRDGGHRGVPPEETYRRFKHHVSPVTGVVRMLERVDNRDGGLVHNYFSGHNVALTSSNYRMLRANLRSVSGGKGSTGMQAKTGALCEAIERYSGTYQGYERSINTRLRDLDGLGIHPNDCMNFSERQYANRDRSNADADKFHTRVPAPFDEDMQTPWTEALCLNDNSTRYLPSLLCYYNFPWQDESVRFAYPDSNGSAAGNSIEEAVLQGFLEMVERDAASIWWHNRISRPAVDLDSFDDEYFRAIVDYYGQQGRRLWVIDLTHDMGIPAFAAVSVGDAPRQSEILLGFGAHLEARVGISRAITELNQFLPMIRVEQTDPKKRYLTEDSEVLNWFLKASIEDNGFLSPHAGPCRQAGDYPKLWSGDLREDIQVCVNRAAEQGMQTLVVDHTRPDIGLNVVRVFVPGMRHFWRRLGSGRLYDVPVKMGWLTAPQQESALNPISVFF